MDEQTFKIDEVCIGLPSFFVPMSSSWSLTARPGLPREDACWPLGEPTSMLACPPIHVSTREEDSWMAPATSPPPCDEHSLYAHNPASTAGGILRTCPASRGSGCYKSGTWALRIDSALSPLTTKVQMAGVHVIVLIRPITVGHRYRRQMKAPFLCRKKRKVLVENQGLWWQPGVGGRGVGPFRSRQVRE